MSACVLRMVCPMCGGNAGKLQETTMQLSEMVQIDQCIDSVNGTVFGDGTPCIEEQLETATRSTRTYTRTPITSSLQNTVRETIQIVDCLAY